MKKAGRLAIACCLALALAAASAALTSTSASSPAGTTGIALDSAVELSWQAVPGASGYAVYRGTSPSSITQLLTSAGGISTTSFTDSSAANGTTYYYASRSITGGVESPDSLVVQATPVSRGCSSGNPVVLENCYPGSSGWRVSSPPSAASGGIEGYATAKSIDKGGSVDLKVNSATSGSFRLEVYRTGYYGGAGARLFAAILGIPAVRQPACRSDATTGLYDCSSWSVSTTLTTTTDWPSGIYLLRIVRDSDGAENQILLVVRDDTRSSAVLYGVSFATYEAYNSYGGKSLYDYNSSGAQTVSGTARAVKVSFDRPFANSTDDNDYFAKSDYAFVYWLEQQGYDVDYEANTDLEHDAAGVRNHLAYISAAHDEYVSAAMRASLQQARDAGVSLLFSGSNEMYWRIRFEPSPVSAASDRVLVCYKTVASGVVDPSGIPTSTWRDPAGANLPENALSGIEYIGDNSSAFFPLVVTAAQGADPIFRYTGLDQQAPGTSTALGSSLVGWEWDARAANGSEPAGLKILASSPVSGNIIQNYGANYTTGSAVANVAKYTAPSGALVVTTGTNQWSRGLALNAFGIGEPDQRIKQITVNVLADMNVRPGTPSAGITIDSQRPPAPATATAQPGGSGSVTISWGAVAGVGGYHLYRTLSPRSGGTPLGTRVDSSLITGTSFTDTGLSPSTTYYYVVTAVSGSSQSDPSNEASATTASLPPPQVTVQKPVADATGISPSTSVRATFSRGMDAATITSATFTLAKPDTSVVPATVVYDTTSQVATLTAGSALDLGTVYTVRLAASIKAADGAALGTAVTWTFTTAATLQPALTVSASSPPGGATGVLRGTSVSATFSRGVDASTVTATSFTLKAPDGSLVPASVTYNGASQQATLTPSSLLTASTTYTARLATSIEASDGTPLSTAYTWSFTTNTCPCSLFASTARPTLQPSGSYELGVKVKVDQPLSLTSIRYYKASGETGTHTGRVWSASGTKLAQVNFANETAAGWQEQVLPTPFQLQANTVYVVSVNANTAFAQTISGLQTAINSGPLHSVADGLNGVYATPGSFPNQTYSSSNYFVDVVVGPAGPLTVSSKSPAAGSTGVNPYAAVRATFSRALDATTITGSAVTLTRPDGTTVAATVTYDASSFAAVLTPSTALALATTYTVRLDPSIRSADGVGLSGAVTWQFTTATQAPAPLTVSSHSPADGATSVSRSTTIRATFARAIDQSTLTSSSFTLRASDGSLVGASLSYDAASLTATLTPQTALLAGATTYTAALGSGIQANDGTPLTPTSFSFMTAACPCSLFSTVLTPVLQPSGSYELGVKIKVDQPLSLTSIRYYKASGETGTHAGTVWTASGLPLARVTFTNESASGWQQQALSAPLQLQADTVYVVSVNANTAFAQTISGLQTAINSGPLHSVADGLNGVYATPGSFPNQTYSSSNYFVDVVVQIGSTDPLAVTSTTPAAGASAVALSASVRAAFSRAVDASTVTASSFTLRTPDGTLVPASVSYDAASQVATLTPSQSLPPSTTLTAQLDTSVKASDGTPLAAVVSWSFTTVAGTSPTVTAKSPADGSGGVAASTAVTATFSVAMDASSITGASFTLKGPSGASVAASVAYDAATLRATLTPSAALAAGTTYTAALATSVRASDGTPLAAVVSWSFTTQFSTVRINTGGGAYTSSSGIAWLADSSFSGGRKNSTSHVITGTTDPRLYKDERWGNFSYAIPVANGNYDVKLHFVEMYYVTGGCVGKRVFSIDIADTATSPDIADLDICAAVGPYAALVKTISGVQVSDGVLNIQAIYGSADDPEIAAIEVVLSSG
jgi:hypothetical protein